MRTGGRGVGGGASQGNEELHLYQKPGQVSVRMC